jgi:glutathione S-transferase
VKVTLYGIPGSHAVRSARLMLEYKGIPYKRVDLFPVVTRFVVPRLLRFPGNRVPALKIDGKKVQGTLDISRELEQIEPDPPLFPSDPARRTAVEEAERWGDGFQQMPRTIIWWAFKNAPARDMATYLRGAKLGLPAGLLARTAGPIVWGGRKLNDSYDPEVERLLSELPASLDKVDAWIADGTLNGEQLNAADFQIAPTLRLLQSMEDLAPAIEGRPAAKLAERVQPEAPGHIGPVFRPRWLERLRRPVAA